MPELMPLIYYFRKCSHGATIYLHPVEIIGSFGLRAKPALWKGDDVLMLCEGIGSRGGQLRQPST